MSKLLTRRVRRGKHTIHKRYGKYKKHYTQKNKKRI